MFSKKKETTKIDREQRELFEYAQLRVKKKKNLFRHFIIFLAGAVVLIIVNEVLKYGEDFRPFQTPWFVWAILIWFFIFLVHVLNVFLLDQFMNKKWEHEQIERLVAKQKTRIAELQTRVDQDHPIPGPRSGIIRPDQPLGS